MSIIRDSGYDLVRRIFRMILTSSVWRVRISNFLLNSICCSFSCAIPKTVLSTTWRPLEGLCRKGGWSVSSSLTSARRRSPRDLSYAVLCHFAGSSLDFDDVRWCIIPLWRSGRTGGGCEGRAPPSTTPEAVTTCQVGELLLHKRQTKLAQCRSAGRNSIEFMSRRKPMWTGHVLVLRVVSISLLLLLRVYTYQYRKKSNIWVST
jgi:hypothetical protein